MEKKVNSEKECIKSCRRDYLKFLDRSEIDIDFTFEEDGFNITGLKLPSPENMIIKYENSGDKKYCLGYEGYIIDDRSPKYAKLFYTQYDEKGVFTLDGFILDKVGIKRVVGLEHKDLARECFNALDKKYKEAALSREQESKNLDVLV